MITNQDIALWFIDHPWQSADQVEQDLLLSQAICKIASEPLLEEELVLRGGTAYHKLFLSQPYRYSEDLDYVRTTAGGIGSVMKRLTALGGELGYKVSTKMGMYPKAIWKFEHASGTPGKIKIEINTIYHSLEHSDTVFSLARALSPPPEYRSLLALNDTWLSTLIPDRPRRRHDIALSRLMP